VLLAVPPAETFSTPPLLTVVPMAVPLASTVSMLPLCKLIPLEIWPALIV
jgi:hypothetical protein